jgi:hypothetical protein
MTGPMIGLYLVGLVVIERKERIRERKVRLEAARLDGE